MQAVYVGRVGALAVALGVGTAILGCSAVAAADTGGSAGGESTQAGDTARATAKTRGGNRRSAQDSQEAGGQVTAARRGAGARSGVAAPTSAGRSPLPSSAPAAQSPADLLGALLTPGGMANLVQQTMTSLIGDLFAAFPMDVPVSDAALIPEITSAPSADPATADAAPVMMVQPDAMSVVDGVALDALGGGAGDPLAATLAWAAVAASRQDPAAATPEVAPAALVTTGEPVDATAAAVDADTQYQAFPKLPVPEGLPGTPTGDMWLYRPTIVNNLANTFATAYQLPTPEACVKGKGCPLEGFPPSVSVANTVGMYAFNVIYALVAPAKDDAAKDQMIAQAVQQLASQPLILDFIAQTTASKFVNMPQAVQNLIGTAASTFVSNTFGSTAGPDPKQANFVALKFVPFLKALNIPTKDPAFAVFLNGCKTDASGQILKQFNLDQQYKGRDALVTFFSDRDVQGYMSSAFTDSINVMLVPTFANYLGTNAATAILGEGNTNIPTLSNTIGNALSTLFSSSAGGIVATEAGTAFGTTFLSQSNVPTILANTMVNDLVSFLSPKGSEPKLPFPRVDLLPAIAPAADYATTSFVNSLFTPPNLQPVSQDLGAFITTLIPGVLGNPGVQQVLGDDAAKAVTAYLGDDAFAQAVGTQVGIAVSNLVANSYVQQGLTTWVNALGSSILGSSNAVAAIADAAGQWVKADLTDPKDEAAKQAIAVSLRKNAAIDAAVGQSVTAGVIALFNDDNVLSAVNSEAVSLITNLLGNTDVQSGLAARVSSEVAKLFTNQALGQAVGAQAGAAVVRLLGDSAVRSALVALVDTMFSDFFKADGVLAAFAKAAGEIAAADVAMDPDAAKAAQAEFKANTDVQQAVGSAVGGAVRTLLTDPTVLAALDHAAGSLVAGLVADPEVEAGLSATVSKDVSKLLGGGQFGDAVGAQVGTAVAGLLSQTSVQNALAGLVDTELGDFFTSDGVVDAFAAVADTYVLDILSGNGANAAKDARKSLQDSTAIQDAVGTIVTKSVAELLEDSDLWSTLDASAARLVGSALADPAVQAGVSERVYLAVWKQLNGTNLAIAVADQVSTAVVDLMNNPNISAGLVGVVDTVLGDFFRTDGVVTAFSDAAGQLASAAVAGTFPDAEKQVQAELRANTAVQQGVNTAVGDAVTALLADQTVVSALNDKLASLMSGLLGDPAVQAGLDEVVATEVSKIFGGGALGDAVGAQVGTAVVEIVTNPIVKDALEGLVDTELGDFFRAPGVVAAFAAAADTFALDVLTGTSVSDAVGIAATQLRNAPAIDTAVQNIVTATVAELLGNADVWGAVDGTTTRLVADLLDDPDVQDAVYGKVYAAVFAAFNRTPLGEAVGDKAAAAVVSLMKNPAVSVALQDVVDTITQDFFGYSGVVAAFSTAAGQLAAAELEQNKQAAQQAIADLKTNPDVEQAAGVAVGDAVTALLTDDNALSELDDTAAKLVNDLLDDPAVGAKLDADVIKAVSTFLDDGPLGQAVGTQVGTAVLNFLSNTDVRRALVGLVDTELGDFFRSSGVADAFAEAATTFTVEVLTGENIKTASDDAAKWLRANAAVDDAVQGVVTESVATLLSNTYVIRAFDNDLSTLLTDLGPYAGQIVTVLATRSLGESPKTASIAAPVGQALGAAVDQLLAVPGFGAGVVTVIASVVPDFLGQFGVPSAVAGVVGQYAESLVAFGDPTIARKTAEITFTTNPTINSAAKTTIADSLILTDLNLLSNPVIQQGLGATVTTLITTLAADPAVQAFIADRDGDAVAELLTNTAVVGEIATAVGSVVAQLLGYPGFNAALLGAVNQYADDVIDGTEMSTAQQSAVKTLQSAPVTVAAVNSVVPPAVNTLLGYPDVRQALGLYADEVTISSLQKSRFNIAFLDNTIGKVADGTVESLLTRTSGVTLADRLVVNLVLGMPVRDWRGFTTQEIIADPFLQVAVGMSLGQGIGSLFGDNIVAQLIGVAAAVPATLAVAAGSLIAGLLQWLFGRPSYAVAPSTAAAHAGHQIRADLYVTNTVILSPVGVAS